MDDSFEYQVGVIVEQVLDYKNAINRCVKFIKENGRPKHYDDIIGIIINELEIIELYEACDMIIKTPYIDSDIEPTEFTTDALIIKDYESNLLLCLHIFDDIEVFYLLNYPRDYVKLMNIIIEYFQNELDYEQMNLLTNLLDIVKNEYEQEKIYYKTGINPDGVPYYFFNKNLI